MMKLIDELVTTAAEADEVIIRKCQQGQKNESKTPVPIGKISRDSTVPLERREIYGTIQRDRHELRSLQLPGWKRLFRKCRA